MHATANGLMNVIQGGDFGSAFASSIVSALSSRGIDLLCTDGSGNPLKGYRAFRVGSFALVGGLIREANGGDFIKGATASAIQMICNDLMHENDGGAKAKALSPWQKRAMGDLMAETNQMLHDPKNHVGYRMPEKITSPYQLYTDAYAMAASMKGKTSLTNGEVDELDDQLAITMFSVVPVGRFLGAARTLLTFNANGGWGIMTKRFMFMYKNPNCGGGTIFAYKNPITNGRFRLDFHGLPQLNRGNTLHFHTNYWRLTNSPHRSLNPFRFGKPIK